MNPGFKNSTTCDAVTDCCRLTQHGDTGVRTEVTLSQVRAPHKSCTQSRAPLTSFSATKTRSRLMMNFSLEVTGPRTMGAGSWNTFKKDK